MEWITGVWLSEFREAVVELSEEAFEIDATDGGRESGEVGACGEVHAAGATEVTFFEMEECDGSLDQPLKERSFCAGLFAPEVFQHIMALEECSGIEQANAFLDAWIRKVAFRHGWLRSVYERMGSMMPDPCCTSRVTMLPSSVVLVQS
ncbi:MAG: hypothetical protein RLZZ436_4168 [Planctomycetota bacterium]